MNVYDLKDRVAIVTGGAQGIGLAVATRILTSGGKVSLWDRDTALLNKTVAGLNDPAPQMLASASENAMTRIRPLPYWTAEGEQPDRATVRFSRLVPNFLGGTDSCAYTVPADRFLPLRPG